MVVNMFVVKKMWLFINVDGYARRSVAYVKSCVVVMYRYVFMFVCMCVYVFSGINFFLFWLYFVMYDVVNYFASAYVSGNVGFIAFENTLFI